MRPVVSHAISVKPDPPKGSAHLAHTQPQLMRQPQYLTDLPHRHSHPGHRLPLWFFTGTADLLIRMSMGGLAKRSSATVRNHRNAVRNGLECCPRWIGMTVRDGLE